MYRLYILILMIGLFGCNNINKEPGKPVIGLSILPQKYLVASIADTLADVVVMVPPGASPATWEATPAQMKSLGDALIYFRIGHIGFEKAWMAKAAEINPEMKITDLSENLTLRGMSYDHGDHSHSGIDPHVWMSPGNMEIMAGKVFDELLKLFPQHQEFLERNYSALLVEIEETGQFAGDQLSAYKGETFLIFHPSLGYFADDYGLLQAAIEYEGKEPSSAHMIKIIDMARSKGIKVIFVQQEFDRRNAEIIANEIEGQVIEFNPLSESWPDEIKNLSLSLKNSFQK